MPPVWNQTIVISFGARSGSLCGRNYHFHHFHFDHASVRVDLMECSVDFLQRQSPLWDVAPKQEVPQGGVQAICILPRAKPFPPLVMSNGMAIPCSVGFHGF